MGNSQLIFESIFKKPVSSADTIDYLKGIVNEYPSFIPAQFFLLQLTKKEEASYNLLAARTAIMFNNNYWLNYQLLEAKKLSIEKNPLSAMDAVNITDTEGIIPSVEIITNTTITEVKEDNITALADVTESVEPAIPTVVNEEEILSDVAEIKKGETTARAIEIMEAEKPEEVIEAEPGMINSPETHTLAATDETEKIIEINSSCKLVESNMTSNPAPNSTAITELPVIEDEINAQEFKHIPINISKEDTDTTEDSFVFEPLHTTDYFASVGIKLSEETKATDKLGMQLKSFTDWLKTMKKIAATEPAIDKQQTEQTDYTIQKLAEKSNAAGETLTEAMADVLIQQGRIGKAIAVLEKLSLLNPSKSVFFAAKINQLKEQ